MRKAALIIILLLPLISIAVPKTATALLQEAKNSRKNLSSADLSKVTAELKKIEASVNAAVAAHKKIATPNLEPQEEQVLYVLYSLRPAFKLASGTKPSKKDCELAEHQVELDDKGTKPESTPLSPEAKESMEWIKLLCK